MPSKPKLDPLAGRLELQAFLTEIGQEGRDELLLGLQAPIVMGTDRLRLPVLAMKVFHTVPPPVPAPGAGIDRPGCRCARVAWSA